MVGGDVLNTALHRDTSFCLPENSCMTGKKTFGSSDMDQRTERRQSGKAFWVAAGRLALVVMDIFKMGLMFTV